MSKSKQQMRKNLKHKNKNYYDSINKLYLLPVMFIIGILPFIVRYHKYSTGLSDFNWFLADDTSYDFFLYFKQVFFLITCTIMLLILAYKIYQDKKKIKFTYIFIPLALYALLVILSTVFSKYPSFGLSGIYEQFESIFVLLGYCLTAYYAYVFINYEEDIKFLLQFFVKCVIVLGFLGVLQATGHDFITSHMGLKLALPREMWGSIDSFSLKFGKYCSFLTLYNPNYVGVYVALIVPLLICLSITSKNKKDIIYYIIAILSLFVSLYGSNSDAGIIGLGFGTILILFFLRRYIFRKAKIAIPVFLAGVFCIVIVTVLKYNVILHKVSSVFSTGENEKSLTKIDTDKDLTLTYKGNEMKVSLNLVGENNYEVFLVDSNNQEVTKTVNPDTGENNILDERFAGIAITPVSFDNKICIDIKIDGKEWIFTNQLGDDTYYYYNQCGRWDKIIEADSAVFTGHESFATGRGYIWSRTIPLLKKYIFLGSGADTFVIVYPQEDYVNLYNYGFGGEVLTKPHSFYLQVGVQTGVFSLIAFVVFYLIYFATSIKLYIKGHFDTIFSQLGVGILIGSACYMITMITNDSCLAVAPVYWGFLGIGIAVNQKVKEINLKEKERIND